MSPFIPKITVLGCISGKPTASGGTCGILVEYSPKHYLIYDCPEGTYVKLLQYGIPLGCLRYIVISHMHPDHMAGLLTLISGLSEICGSSFPSIYGPQALSKYLEVALPLTDLAERFSCPLKLVPIAPFQTVSSVITADGPWSFIFFPLAHRIECHGLAMVRDTFSMFDAKKALDSGVSLDKLPELKRRAEGTKFSAVYPRLKIMLCSDNDAKRLLADRAYGSVDGATFLQFIDQADLRNPDLLLHEFTFTDYHQEKASLYGHSCTTAIGGLCNELRPKRVLLNHFSVRYKRTACSNRFGVAPPKECVQLTEWHRLFGKVYSTAYATEDKVYAIE
ncbi:Metal-dependent hydrolase [Giardia lamblia P15]|uniref:Metal-dependent hydrolase n=1 Tax=Giardia intestinalis (strain P15) TaxID=658858 RepID=E1F1S2_GIAIA|nr:Metal-dependent hydrolase [Giardia lamblia P15]